MAYRQVYFHIHTKGYSSGWSSDTDRSAFKEGSRQLFQELGWTIKLGHIGGCDVVTKDRQDLYLHPTSFSGVIDESNIQSLQKQIPKAQTFHYEGVDCYPSMSPCPIFIGTMWKSGTRRGTSPA